MKLLTRNRLLAALADRAWYPASRTPLPRAPIFAAVQQGFRGDDFDPENEEELRRDVAGFGECVPVCGCFYHSGASWVITPYTSLCCRVSGPILIHWNRVQNWRYLDAREAPEHWRALLFEADKN